MSTYEGFHRRRRSRIIEQTTLPSGMRVSTVHLGLDHQYGDGPPLIFETMVFGPSNYVDLDMERYSTKEAAQEGHARMVAKWADRTPGDDEEHDETDDSAGPPDGWTGQGLYHGHTPDVEETP